MMSRRCFQWFPKDGDESRKVTKIGAFVTIFLIGRPDLRPPRRAVGARVKICAKLQGP